jgi:hypothetical protein
MGRLRFRSTRHCHSQRPLAKDGAVMKSKLQLTVKVCEGSEPHTISCNGRDAWALLELIKAGPKGCTPIENPGPRWSGYVFNLRQMGLSIQTIDEPHGGPFAGTHARYVLKSVVRIVESNNDQEAA